MCRTHRVRRGAALIEFALVFPMLSMLLFGFVELGRMLYQQNELTKALLTGARYIAREPEALDGGCAPGPAWAAASAQAVQLVALTGAGAARLPGLDAAGAVTFTPRADAVDGELACVIEADARADFAALLGDAVVPFMDLGPIELNAQEEERYIGD